MIQPVAYHTSLADEVEAPEQTYYHSGMIRAFQLDLTTIKALPWQFDGCDLIYAEPPIDQHSIELYMRRAGKDPRGDELKRIAAVLRHEAESGRPCVFICGARIATLLPPAVRHPIRFVGPGKHLQGLNISYVAYNVPTAGEWGRTDNMLWALAQSYDCVGDPCCGYGNSGRAFIRAGKRAVLTDVNPRCIGYIAARAHGWRFGL